MLEVNITSIIQAVNFVILLFVLKKLVLDDLVKAMQARREKIQKDIEEAEKLNEASKNLKLEYEKKLKDISNEAQTLILKAKGEADLLKQDIIINAKADASRIIEKSNIEAESQKSKLMEDAVNYIANSATLMASKIIKESVDEKTNQELVKQIVSKFGV